MANVIEITSFDDPRLDVYARLTEAQLLNRFEPAGQFHIKVRSWGARRIYAGVPGPHAGKSSPSSSGKQMPTIMIKWARSTNTRALRRTPGVTA